MDTELQSIFLETASHKIAKLEGNEFIKMISSLANLLGSETTDRSTKDDKSFVRSMAQLKFSISSQVVREDTLRNLSTNQISSLAKHLSTLDILSHPVWSALEYHLDLQKNYLTAYNYVMILQALDSVYSKRLKGRFSEREVNCKKQSFPFAVKFLDTMLSDLQLDELSAVDSFSMFRSLQRIYMASAVEDHLNLNQKGSSASNTDNIHVSLQSERSRSVGKSLMYGFLTKHLEIKDLKKFEQIIRTCYSDCQIRRDAKSFPNSVHDIALSASQQFWKTRTDTNSILKLEQDFPIKLLHSLITPHRMEKSVVENDTNDNFKTASVLNYISDESFVSAVETLGATDSSLTKTIRREIINSSRLQKAFDSRSNRILAGFVNRWSTTEGEIEESSREFCTSDKMCIELILQLYQVGLISSTSGLGDCLTQLSKSSSAFEWCGRIVYALTNLRSESEQTDRTIMNIVAQRKQNKEETTIDGLYFAWTCIYLKRLDLLTQFLPPDLAKFKRDQWSLALQVASALQHKYDRISVNRNDSGEPTNDDEAPTNVLDSLLASDTQEESSSTTGNNSIQSSSTTNAKLLSDSDSSFLPAWYRWANQVANTYELDVKDNHQNKNSTYHKSANQLSKVLSQCRIPHRSNIDIYYESFKHDNEKQERLPVGRVAALLPTRNIAIVIWDDTIDITCCRKKQLLPVYA